MKKLRFIWLFVLLAFLSACVSQEDILAILDDAKYQVDVIPMTENDLDLIKQIKVDNYTVHVAWTSDKVDVIDQQGNVTRPSFEEGSQLVTLVATLSIGGESITRSFLVLVPALDPVVLVTVTFDTLGGTAVAPQTLDAGMTLLPYTAPVKAGFVFTGWFLDEELETAFNEEAPVMESLTLYAGYEVASYAVTFNTDGGSAIEPLFVDHGLTVNLPQNPTKEGYTFEGWYTNVGLTEAFDPQTEVTQALTLYAKWTLNMYVVTFDSNEGTAVQVQEVNHGHVALLPAAPTKVGYTFDGWYSDEALTLAFDFDTLITANITLYAKWTLNTYEVTFDSNEGSLVNPQTVNHGDKATEPQDPIKVGYTFDAWYTDEALTVAFDFDTPIIQALTLYAKYTLNSYQVTFDANEGSLVNPQTVNHGEKVTKPADPTKDGFDFVNWYSDMDLTVLYDFDTPVTQVITLYAKWEEVIVSFDVIFESNGGSTVATQNIVEGQKATLPANPTKDGYDFVNWYSDVDLTVLYDFDTPVNATLTLYAKWEEAVAVPEGTAITTPQEFMTATTNTSASSVFYLANDIDFTDVVWNQTGSGAYFRGTLNGNGKTISNITIVGAAANTYTGIFQRVDGATIYDLTIDTITVSQGRAGALIGRVETNTVTINDVVVKNATINGSDSNGNGILIGNASLGVIMNRVTIENSSVETTTKNVGAVIGRADHIVHVTDLYVKNSSARSSANSTDAGIGGVVGYTNAATVDIVFTRVVLENVELIGRSSGSLIGYYRVGKMTVNDSLTEVTFTPIPGEGTRYNGVIGRRDDNTSTTLPVFNHYYGIFYNMAVHSQTIQLPNEFIVTSDDLNLTWWDTNIVAFSQSALWSFNTQSNFYILD